MALAIEEQRFLDYQAEYRSTVLPKTSLQSTSSSPKAKAVKTIDTRRRAYGNATVSAAAMKRLKNQK